MGRGEDLAWILAAVAGKEAAKKAGKKDWMQFAKDNIYGSIRSPFFNKRYKTKFKLKTGYERIGGYYGKYNGSRGRHELKFFDVEPIDLSPIPPGSTLLINSINKIVEGTGESQRIGRRCTIKRIEWKYQIRLLSGNSVSADDTVRLVMYLDRQCNGASAGIMQLFESSGNFQTFYKLENQDRFSILFDKQFTINATGENVTTNARLTHAVNGTFTKKCNIPIEFSGVTGAITEIRSMNVGIMVLSDNGDCALASNLRVRFVG